MLKKSICAFVIICAWFAIVTPPEPVADDNTQAWYYVTVIGVCKNDNSIVLSSYTDRVLQTWMSNNPYPHPPDTRKWEQVCWPVAGGGVYCEDQYVYRHTPHVVYWANATHQTVTREVEAYACR